jgi:hypothetical protein
MCLKLPFEFDPVLLQEDLARVDPDDWSAHYNERDFGGEWKGAALRSAAGSSRDIQAAPAGEAQFMETPLLARCHYFREVLNAFHCPLKSVRLLSLAPGSFIREHSDHALGYDDGEIRIHIPVITDAAVEFYVCGERLLLEEGRCYFINVNLPHRVNNRSSISRIHLVIDAEVNDWVHRIFRENSQPVERSAVPPGSLEDFRKTVIGDESLQRQLRDIPDRREFTAQVIALGRDRGFHFHESDVDAGFRSRPTPAPNPPGAGWAPVRVRFPEREVESIWTGSRRFTEPFFEDSIRASLRNPFASLFRRSFPLHGYEEAESAQGSQPTGLIFHMSRCGSTLVSQMLAAIPRVNVISEAPVIDEILQATLVEKDKIEALRSIIRGLGRSATGHATGYFIKFDAWHIHNLALIRTAFPGVPWIFVYRDPVEVLVSHLRIPGRQTIPGAMDPVILGLDPNDVTGLSRTRWCARVLGNFCRRALDFREDPNGLFIDYRELPEAVTGPIAKHFGLVFQPGDESRMRETARFNAKNPSTSFESDTKAKQDTGKELLLDIAAARLDVCYEELRTASSAFRRT